MGVITHEEYADIQEKKIIVTKPESGKKPLPGFAFKQNEIECHLFHPDNPSNGRINNKYNVQVEGKKFELDIIDGVIVTNDRKIKHHLIKKGFVFIYEKEIEMQKPKDGKAKDDKAEGVENPKGIEQPEDKEVNKEVKIEEKAEAKKASDKKDYFLLSTFCKKPEELKSACTQKMFVPHAPKGKCNTAFWCYNKEIKVTLTDGIVLVDKRDHLMMEEMVKHDFVKI